MLAKAAGTLSPSAQEVPEAQAEIPPRQPPRALEEALLRLSLPGHSLLAHRMPHRMGPVPNVPWTRAGWAVPSASPTLPRVQADATAPPKRAGVKRAVAIRRQRQRTRTVATRRPRPEAAEETVPPQATPSPIRPAPSTPSAPWTQLGHLRGGAAFSCRQVAWHSQGTYLQIPWWSAEGCS